LARRAEPPAPLQATCARYEAELARNQGQFARALTVASAARRRLEGSDETQGNLYSSLLSLLVYLYRDNGDLASAFAAADRLAELNRAAGRSQTLDASVADRGRALLLADAGEIVAALALMQDVVARWGRAGETVPPPLLLTLAELELASGRTVDAERTVARAEASSRALASAAFDAGIANQRLRLALAQGQTEAARRWLDAIDTLPGAGLLRFAASTPATARAQVLMAEGRSDAARQTIERELSRLDHAGIGHLEQRADAWRTAARLALATGDPAGAAAHARAALAAASRAARDVSASARVGEARLLLAQALQAQGAAASARLEAVGAATSLARGLGAAHVLVAEANALATPP